MSTSLLRRWLALCALVLIAATWRLWTPQVVFPQIPFFGVLCTVPGWVDWIALAMMITGLVGLLLTPGERGASALRVVSPRAVPWFAGLFTASLTLLVLLDQHRFQPWAYQFAIVAVVLAFVPAPRAMSLLRLLTIGIYFWSAVSKLDYTFLHGLGPELLRGTLTAFGLEPGRMQPEVATAIALAFPLDELAVAALLAFRRTRKYGLVLAIAMHLLLLATLGPWGLDHSWGVLLWNVYFIGQNVLLFAPMASGGRQPSESSSDTSDPSRERTRGADAAPLASSPASSNERRRLTPAARLASWVVYAAVILPVLEPFGWLDHWVGWAVYAPAGEKVVLVTAFSPEGMSDYFVEFPYSNSGVMRFDRWSLDTLPVPICPDSRFAVGVSLAVIERHDSEKRSSLKHSSMYVQHRADRFTGDRTSEWHMGIDSIRAYADSFWLNALPRKIGGW